MSRRVTLKFLAEKAGVNIGLISKVVNGVAQGEISSQKEAIIKELVRKYNYAPLASARSLVTRRNHQIAFLISSATTLGIANYYFGTILAGVHDLCLERGYQCVVNIFDFLHAEKFVMPDNLRRMSIDGCILSGFINRTNLERLSAMELPLVAIDVGMKPANIPSLEINTPKVIDAILRFASERGYTRVAIGGETERIHIYRQLQEERFPHLTLSPIARGKEVDEFAFGRRFSQEFLAMSRSSRPTFLFASDHFCMAFLEGIRPHGIKCPDDIGILSIDTPMAEWAFPPLSMLHTPVYEYGRKGTELLLDIIEKKSDIASAVVKAGTVEFPFQIIERASTVKLQGDEK